MIRTVTTAILLLIAIALGFGAAADPIKIFKSQLPPNFESYVEAYSREFLAWKDHQEHVATNKFYTPYPPPTADSLVMESVDSNGKPNYQIEDDTDVVQQENLANKKELLISAVRQKEKDEIARIIPDGKRRAFDLRQDKIVAADSEREARIYAEQPVGMFLWLGIGPKKDAAKAKADAVAQRTPDDAKFMEDQILRRNKISAIERAAAEMESTIEDLTISNIDDWRMPGFPD